MKIKYLSLIFPALLLFSACDKDGDLKVETPSLNVSGYTVTDAVDTLGNVVKQVEFNLEGDADVISFYSGQVFEDYAFKDGRILPTQALNVSFEYSASMGSGTNPEWEQLSIHYSKDFNGSMTAEAINSAEWTDITDRFALPLAKDITARTPTQDDLADLVTPGEPLYIAFKYVTPPRTVSSAYSTWDIFNFKVSQQTALGSTALVDQTMSPFLRSTSEA